MCDSVCFGEDLQLPWETCWGQGPAIPTCGPFPGCDPESCSQRPPSCCPGWGGAGTCRERQTPTRGSKRCRQLCSLQGPGPAQSLIKPPQRPSAGSDL